MATQTQWSVRTTAALSALATCCLHVHTLTLKAWSYLPPCFVSNSVWPWQLSTQWMPDNKPLWMWWNEDPPIAAFISGGMNTAFWMVQNKGTYLEPNFHLVNWPGKTARALLGLWWHFTSPTNYLHLHLTRLQSVLANFHPHASLFLLLLLDGDGSFWKEADQPFGVGAD